MATSTICILLICGLFTNMVSAIFGIGGGVLMVPILRTLFPELPLQMIAATSLTIVMCTATINLLFFRRQKIKIDYLNMLFWSIAMIIGVQIGFELSFYFSSLMISLVFTVSLSALALKTFFTSSREESPNCSKHRIGTPKRRHQLLRRWFSCRYYRHRRWFDSGSIDWPTQRCKNPTNRGLYQLHDDHRRYR